ncbi:MAG TPA: T9SS type A sorting domain-containing protein [Puia sp.]|jgi:hypothetical protein|nr:T9SS type A sorting domain-containing protein [Puia sp.]
MPSATINAIRIFFSITFLSALSAKISFAQTNVLMQHNNLKRTGWNSNETQLTQASVTNGNFGLIFSRSIDDQTYSQPLIMTNLPIGGGAHNVVIVTTVNNSVYAFDADDSNVVNPYWHVNLTYSPGTYRPIKNTDMTGACGGAYTDFSGNMGIVGTPVIDSTTNTIYVVSRSVTLNGQTFVQYLHALDIITGAEKPGSPIYITATYPGNGEGGDGTTITFDEQRENPRPGLLLYKGVVYISWASHCDWEPYHGWVIGYDASTLQQKYVYNASPNGGLAGIWMSGQAPAVDDNGFIYLSTGNGTTDIGTDTTDRAESLLKLSTASGNLKVVDYFTPNDYDNLNQQDLDYGVDGVMLIPNSNLSLSGSKESYLYLIDDTKMGGMNPNNTNVLQQLNVNATSTDYDKHIHGSPVYYQDNNGNEYVYAWAEGGFLKQYPFKRATMLFDTLNKIVGNTTLPEGMPGAMLALSSNGSQQGAGILWGSHPINGDANHGTVPGILQAFDATNVQHELWNSNMSGKRDSVGNFAKFVVPTIANGKVYLATFSNKLNVYGLNAPSASSCPNPLPAPWHSADVGYVVPPGDVCYNSGVFTITASGDDIWNGADAFHNVYQSATGGNVEMIARIVSIQNTDAWAKCGIMFRSNLDQGSANVFMAITSGNGVAFQNRPTQNAISTSQNQGGFNAPYWVRIVQFGNQYIGYMSADGHNWTAFDSVVVALGSNPYLSLAYTSHNNGVLGTAVVDSVSIIVHDSVSGELINFTAQNINNKYSQLSWTTTSETNTAYFDVERSTDTTNFQSIGQVQAQGSSANPHQYTFNDIHPFGGINYYRLKQVNADSSFSYSKIVSVTFNFSNIIIFPNPSTGVIYIQNNVNFSNNQSLNIEIINSLGQILLRQTGSLGNIITLDLAPDIKNDVYIVKVINAKGQVQAKKIFVSR